MLKFIKQNENTSGVNEENVFKLFSYIIILPFFNYIFTRKVKDLNFLTILYFK